MEKIMFFGNLEIAVYWFKEVGKYLNDKDVDCTVNRKFLEIETNGIKLVFRSARDYDRVMIGKNYNDIVNCADLKLEREFEKTIMELIGA